MANRIDPRGRSEGGCTRRRREVTRFAGNTSRVFYVGAVRLRVLIVELGVNGVLTRYEIEARYGRHAVTVRF